MTAPSSPAGAAVLAGLPLGDWANLEIVSDGDGLMATRFRATLATATAVRLGGVPAFLKILPRATESAGPETVDVLNADRLRRIEARLKAITESAQIVPVVRLLEVRFGEDDEFLLIAMQRLVTLQSRVAAGAANVPLAVKLLRRLAPEDAGWVHFDVCPSNIGVDGDDVPWLIDPDSVYFQSEGGLRATQLLCRPFRAVRSVFQEVVRDQMNGGTRIDLLRSRQAMEVAIAAMECAFGREAAIPSERNHVDDWLPEWIESLKPESPTLVSIFSEYMVPALSDGSRVDIEGLADALEARDEAVVSESPVESSALQTGASETRVPSEAAPPTQPSSWQQLVPDARRLRADHMGRGELADYLGRLDSLVSRNPACEEAWLEMMYIYLCFVGDAETAVATLDRATQALPDNAELRHWHDVLSPGRRG